jgi:hypothetical protein
MVINQAPAITTKPVLTLTAAPGTSGTILSVENPAGTQVASIAADGGLKGIIRITNPTENGFVYTDVTGKLLSADTGFFDPVQHYFSFFASIPLAPFYVNGVALFAQPTEVQNVLKLTQPTVTTALSTAGTSWLRNNAGQLQLSQNGVAWQKVATASGTFTAGSVLFAGAANGVITGDNPQFFWDNTNFRLGILNNNPTKSLDVGFGHQFTVDSSGNVILNGLQLTAKLNVYNGVPGSDGILLIGNTATGNFDLATLTPGGSGTITITNGNGSITIDTSQGLTTGSSPAFSGLTLGGSAVVTHTCVTSVNFAMMTVTTATCLGF